MTKNELNELKLELTDIVIRIERLKERRDNTIRAEVYELCTVQLKSAREARQAYIKILSK